MVVARQQPEGSGVWGSGLGQEAVQSELSSRGV